MRATNWTDRTDFQTAARRAGGRRAYNNWRHLLSNVRLGAVVNELKGIGFGRGYQAEIARRLGVHRSTINRDFKKLDLVQRGYRWEEVDLISKGWHRRDWLNSPIEFEEQDPLD